MKKKKEALSKLMEDYKKEVFIENAGELLINGNKQMPYEKQIWKPKNNK